MLALARLAPNSGIQRGAQRNLLGGLQAANTVAPVDRSR
jgi:hypothetical protein